MQRIVHLAGPYRRQHGDLADERADAAEDRADERADALEDQWDD